MGLLRRRDRIARDDLLSGRARNLLRHGLTLLLRQHLLMLLLLDCYSSASPEPGELVILRRSDVKLVAFDLMGISDWFGASC